ncbi:hypothetical protein VNO77_02258 [Canavalia gladiata]|uniref:Uncharacterized protein n=1 Tax=Canavalia gladiata TaxID=3824 RepID=A0AAN9R2W1_CANGL
MGTFIPNSNALVFLLCVAVRVAHGAQDPPALFIFGDSDFDVGTNNFLNTKAKANFAYNGIDFYHSTPTGRFSNGFNLADQLARKFGHKQSPPPYLGLEKNESSFKNNILQGVNFASAGAGILSETGSQLCSSLASEATTSSNLHVMATHLRLEYAANVEGFSSGNEGKCLTQLNDLAVAFQTQTAHFLQDFAYAALPDFKPSFVNSFLLTQNVLNPGLKETKSACCGSGLLNGKGECIKDQNSTVCADRNDHLYWDWFHYTQKASELFADTLFGKLGGHYSAPFNFDQLPSIKL